MVDRNLYGTSTSAAVSQEAYVEGERSFMLRVYNYMTMGLGITGLVAYLVSTSPSMMHDLFQTNLVWVVMLSPFALLFAIMWASSARREQPGLAFCLFMLFAGDFGLSMSVVFAKYAGLTIAKAFFISAATFAGASLYGYTTGKDLSSWGSFLIMGLWGLIIAMFINVIFHSPMAQFVISAAAVILFTGLTAYDTQNIKDMYREGYGSKVSAVDGALQLYLDFLNLFLNILQLLGIFGSDD